MRTSLAALAIALGLFPGLASADPIMSGPLIDAVSPPSASDGLNDAVLGSGGGVYSDDLTDAINGPDVIYSEPLIDVLAGANPRTASGALQIGKDLNCFVMGTPAAFPDDVRIRNASTLAIPAGTALEWQVRTTGEAGTAVLDRTLAPGQTLRLNGVLEDGAEAGSGCSAAVI